MKIDILIPNSKESVRLPNKNRILRRYTLEYLNEELERVKEIFGDEVVIRIIELRNRKVPVDTSADHKLNFKITPLYCPDEVSGDMKPLLQYFDAISNSDYKILLQLTQPKKRALLIADVIKEALSGEERLITSFVNLPFEKWRILNDELSNWHEEIRKEDSSFNLYDGAIYGFKNSGLLWAHQKEKKMILNYKGAVMDIDFKEDLDRFIKEIKE